MRIPALQGGAAAPRKTAVFVALLMVFAVATGGQGIGNANLLRFTGRDG